MTSTQAFPPPGFRRFWAGEAISGFGVYATMIALQVLVVVDLGGGAAQVGVVTSARWLPYLVAGLAVGAVVERFRRRPVMIATDLIRAGLLLLIPAAWAAGVLGLPLLVVIVAAVGTASLINDSASMAYLPRLVPRAHLQPAHARIDGADAVAQTAGPALGGVLVRLAGAPLAMIPNALTYLTAAILLATTRVPEPRGEDVRAPRRRLIAEIVAGLGWVYRRTSGLRRLAIATHVWFVGNTILAVVLAPYALTRLGISPALLGITTAVAGVGALAGATTSSAVGRRWGTGGAIITAHLISTLGMGVLTCAVLGQGSWVAPVLLGAGQGLHGYAMGLSNSHEMSWRQGNTPDGLQARVNTSMRSINRAVIVVVAPVAGLLADRLGLTPSLVGATVVFALAGFLLLLSPFRLARLE